MAIPVLCVWLLFFMMLVSRKPKCLMAEKWKLNSATRAILLIWDRFWTDGWHQEFRMEPALLSELLILTAKLMIIDFFISLWNMFFLNLAFYQKKKKKRLALTDNINQRKEETHIFQKSLCREKKKQANKKTNKKTQWETCYAFWCIQIP